jgi:hypothetical protein
LKRFSLLMDLADCFENLCLQFRACAEAAVPLRSKRRQDQAARVDPCFQLPFALANPAAEFRPGTALSDPSTAFWWVGNVCVLYIGAAMA